MDTPLDENTVKEIVRFLREEASWLRENYIPQNDFTTRISVSTTVNQLATRIEQKELTSR